MFRNADIKLTYGAHISWMEIKERKRVKENRLEEDYLPYSIHDSPSVVGRVTFHTTT